MTVPVNEGGAETVSQGGTANVNHGGSVSTSQGEAVRKYCAVADCQVEAVVNC